LAADESNLVQRARRGDQQAFRTLMERYKRKVFSIAYGMVRDPEVAMDICQESFIKVYRYLETFQGQSSFYTWLYRIVVNLCIDHIRKEAKHDALDYDDMVLRRQPDDAEAWVVPKLLDQNPLAALDRKELSERISRAFEGLSEKHRAVLMLREIEGLSYEDIARTLKIHKGTVMSRLHHARRNLQAALQAYLEERGEGVPVGSPGALRADDDETKDEAADATGA
jgi:RNA polymerase sigma-70 factor (ECF subfamily)